VDDMTQDQSRDQYTRAADELERAVRHYREAARHSELGEHVQAAHHAHIARGHFLNAQGMAHDAARRHADLFSDSVMAEHPVAEAVAPV
jgi:cystathionine beta-lyase family protein involved in aluminum resistance